MIRYKVKPFKDTWQRGYENICNFLPEEDYKKMKADVAKIIDDLNQIDSMSVNQNVRAEKYYDYFKPKFPEFLPAFYGSCCLNKIVDSRDYQINDILRQGLVYDLHNLFLASKRHHHFENAEIYKQMALAPMRIYAIDYETGYYEALDHLYLDWIPRFFSFVATTKNYKDYKKRVNAELSDCYFLAYSDIADFVDAGKFPELEWD